MFKFPEGWAPRIKISQKHFYRGHPCWDWIGATSGKEKSTRGHGYGRAKVPGTRRNIGVHLYMHDQFIAPRRMGLVVDHLCGRRMCCNPHHLEEVTQEVNVSRGKAVLYRPLTKEYEFEEPPF